MRTGRIKNYILVILFALLASQFAVADEQILATPDSAPPASDFKQALAQHAGPLPPDVKQYQGSPPPPPSNVPSQTIVTSSSGHAGEATVEQSPMTYRQSQEAMLDAAPPAEPPSPESVEAFNALLKQNMPLTPQQIVRLRQLIDSSQRAAAIPPVVPPMPVSTTLMINLAPGTTPPAIRLAKGYVTSLVFVDSAGSPWPIAAYDIGDPKAANIQWDGKSNILLIQAVTPYSASDLVIRLTGLMTPITLALVSGQRVVDYRTDIHVAGIGPNTKDLPTGTGLPNSANELLLNVLDGIAPPGGKLLAVKGGDCQAWLLGDTMYLRTRLTLLSPGWVGKMVSPDGMNAYEVQRSSSVLVSQYGEPVELKIEGF
jgi:intracellular multiplication protein IcmK